VLREAPGRIGVLCDWAGALVLVVGMFAGVDDAATRSDLRTRSICVSKSSTLQATGTSDNTYRIKQVLLGLLRRVLSP
jgi:hypothetical protein